GAPRPALERCRREVALRDAARAIFHCPAVDRAAPNRAHRPRRGQRSVSEVADIPDELGARRRQGIRVLRGTTRVAEMVADEENVIASSAYQSSTAWYRATLTGGW